MLVEFGDDVLGWQAEGEGHHGDGMCGQERDLVIPVVVIGDGAGVELQAVVFCFRGKLIGIGRQGSRVDGGVARHEDVDAEGNVLGLKLLDFCVEGFGGFIAAGEEREAACFGDRQGKRDSGGPTCHGCSNDRPGSGNEDSHERFLPPEGIHVVSGWGWVALKQASPTIRAVPSG